MKSVVWPLSLCSSDREVEPWCQGLTHTPAESYTVINNNNKE